MAAPTHPFAPRVPSVLVDRPRLHGLLGPDHGAAWSLVVGPAGSGKTTLIRSWLSLRRERWAWISVAQSSSGPWRLVDLVVRALQRTRPDDPLDAVDALHRGDLEDVLPDLVDELAAGSDEPATIVVVDDAHLLTSHDWDQLAWLLGHLPLCLHVVVSSRIDPPMALGRERASGHMTEIRGSQLAFDLDETRSLIHAALGDGGSAAVARLHDQTQGWAAGLRLAVLACDRASDVDEVMTRFDGTHSTVAEYLLEEVLDHLPADERTFLLRCSVSPVLGPALAEALTGRKDAGAVLERLTDDGVFLSRAQGGDAEYRFHPMLADLLVHDLRRLEPDRLRAQHLHAAGWYLAEGRSVEAVDHLLAAEEYEGAHRLVLDHFADLYRGRHRRDLARWLETVPDEVVAATLDRALQHCRALALLARPSAGQWYHHCAALVAEDDDDRHAELLMLMALHHAIAGDLDELRAFRQQARRRRAMTTVDPLDEIVASWEVRLEAHLGDPHRAVELARALLAMERTLLGDAPALSGLAGALDAAGRHDDAVAVARSAMQRWQADSEPDLPALTEALVVAAADRRRAGSLDEAEDLLDLARALTADHQPAHLLGALTLLEQAAVDRARGRGDGQRDLVAYAEALRIANAPEALVQRVEAAASPGVAPSGPSRIGQPTSALAEPLTERELTILRAMAGHLTFPEIGRDLHISRHTVKSHAQHIYQKLGAASRSEAVAEARRVGLLA